jgi:hypothetical protein
MPVHTRARIAEQQSHADRILAADRTRQRLHAAKRAAQQGNTAKNAIAAKKNAKQGQKRET